MYVCMYVCTYIYIYTYDVYMYIYIYIYIYYCYTSYFRPSSRTVRRSAFVSGVRKKKLTNTSEKTLK